MVSKKSPKGLATGYFIPVLQGSFIASEFYRYPIYSTPPSLIHIDLRDFGLSSRMIRGRLEKQKVIPYWSRKEIEDNPQLLAGSELLWLTDDMGAFVASIQGSALVRLSDDSLIRIVYADNNGHAYRSIGRYLLDQGYLPPGQASLFAIRDWLKQHPDQKKDILAQNPRYIFFKVSLDTTVKGAMGVPLTPGRSVAVDPRFIPLGTPLYTQMTATATHPAMKRLVFAQDVGSAIQGEKRLDVYWGEGEKAEYQASTMKSPIDHLWILLPKSWDKHTIYKSSRMVKKIKKRIYQVGGSVRDELLGLPVHDRDWVVVGATPEEMQQEGFIPVGKDFPVFLHPVSKEEYALARTERKSGKGYKGFTVYANPEVKLEEDLARRDLTINAMAKDDKGQLIDPYGGLDDLQKGILRHVSDAFVEDPLRVLRVARFKARFPHFSIAKETLCLMKEITQSGELYDLVPERIWQELSRGLMEKNHLKCF